jgi:hypothetical protein
MLMRAIPLMGSMVAEIPGASSDPKEKGAARGQDSFHMFSL